MTALVVDASVVVKWSIEDDFSAQALSVSRRHLLAPWLILAETANALWKYVGRDLITASDAANAVRALPRAVEVISDPGLAAKATLLAARLNHPAYDCFYLALAQDRMLPLLTADQRLAELAESVDVTAIRLNSIELDAS